MCWVRVLPSCGGYNVVTVQCNAGLHCSDDWRGMVSRLAPTLLPRHHRHHSHHQSLCHNLGPRGQRGNRLAFFTDMHFLFISVMLGSLI